MGEVNTILGDVVSPRNGVLSGEEFAGRQLGPFDS